MLYSQYERLESKAGGITASNRDFIKACYTVLRPRTKTRAWRDARHTWLREGLEHLKDAKDLFYNVQTGRI